MIVTRRGFLASCIALAAAPAIVRADSLMRIVPRKPLWMGLVKVGSYNTTFVTTGFGALHGYERCENWGHSEHEGLELVKIPKDAEFEIGTPDRGALNLLLAAQRAKCPPMSEILVELPEPYIYLPGGGWAVNPEHREMTKFSDDRYITEYV